MSIRHSYSFILISFYEQHIAQYHIYAPFKWHAKRHQEVVCWFPYLVLGFLSLLPQAALEAVTTASRILSSHQPLH